MSTTIVNLDVLRTLHRIHKQLTDLKERNERGPKKILAAQANIKRREVELEKVREEYKLVRKEGDQKQLQLKTSEEKIKGLKTKLNGAASNREYQILKDQIAADEMSNSVLEDEIIEFMVRIDSYQPRVAEAEGIVKASHVKLSETQAEVEKYASLIQGDIDRLEGELKTCEAEIPQPIRDVYLRMAKQKGEDALAPVMDHACSGCNTQVPLNIEAEIQMARPTFCKSCGRLLYLPE